MYKCKYQKSYIVHLGTLFSHELSDLYIQQELFGMCNIPKNNHPPVSCEKTK